MTSHELNYYMAFS